MLVGFAPRQHLPGLMQQHGLKAADAFGELCSHYGVKPSRAFESLSCHIDSLGSGLMSFMTRGEAGRELDPKVHLVLGLGPGTFTIRCLGC